MFFNVLTKDISSRRANLNNSLGTTDSDDYMEDLFFVVTFLGVSMFFL